MRMHNKSKVYGNCFCNTDIFYGRKLREQKVRFSTKICTTPIIPFFIATGLSKLTVISFYKLRK